MTKRKKGKSRHPRKPPARAPVADEIPDRSENPAKWKYLLIAAVFVAWVAFLVYCWLAGGVDR